MNTERLTELAAALAEALEDDHHPEEMPQWIDELLVMLTELQRTVRDQKEGKKRAYLPAEHKVKSARERTKPPTESAKLVGVTIEGSRRSSQTARQIIPYTYICEDCKQPFSAEGFAGTIQRTMCDECKAERRKSADRKRKQAQREAARQNAAESQSTAVTTHAESAETEPVAPMGNSATLPTVSDSEALLMLQNGAYLLTQKRPPPARSYVGYLARLENSAIIPTHQITAKALNSFLGLPLTIEGKLDYGVLYAYHPAHQAQQSTAVITQVDSTNPPTSEPVFMADYVPEGKGKLNPRPLNTDQRDVLAHLAAGEQYSAEHREGLAKRKICRQLAQLGYVAETTQHADHRLHHWRLTETGLALIRRDAALQAQIAELTKPY